MAFVNPAAVVTVGAVDSHHLLGLYRASVCAADGDCRGGYVCALAVGACLPDCRLGWSCGATLVCSTSGECVDPLGDAGVPSDASPATDAQTRGSDASGRGPGPGPGGVWN